MITKVLFSLYDGHIGDRIRKYIKSHDITRQYLAEIIGVSGSKLDRILQSRTIDTALLFNISKKLKINFFAWYCGEYTEEDTGSTLYNYNVGKSIELQLKAAGMSQTELATEMGVKQPVISKIIRKESIDTGKLVDLCYIFEHNFFKDFYNQPEKILEENHIKYDDLLEKYNRLLIENEHLKTRILDLETQLGK